ncbi:required for meiotic nuclear division protein 1, partial [Tremellales sp. Uapishka_1]
MAPGSPTLPLPYSQVPQAPKPVAKREPRQPMRTSKLGNKLKVLPTQPEHPTIPEEDDGEDEEVQRQRAATDEGEGVEFYTPLSQIPAGTARRDAQRLTKSEKAKLPRVTAYCTAASYNLPAVQAYLSTRPSSYRTHPRLFDTDCLHTPYLPPPSSSSVRSPPKKTAVPEGDLLNLSSTSPTKSTEEDTEVKRRTGFSKRPGGKKRESGTDSENEDDFEEEEWVPDVFLFEYGTVVIWGMTEREEKRFLSSLKKFEIERLSSEDVEMEDLNFYYADYSRIYNDVITLRKGSSYISRSAEIQDKTLPLPCALPIGQDLAIRGVDQQYHRADKRYPKKSVGDRKDWPTEKRDHETDWKFVYPEDQYKSGWQYPGFTRVLLVGPLDPKIRFHADIGPSQRSFPDLEPLYNAARSYLEISQRIDLLNARVDVLQDMLKLLKESVNSSHGERLEAIVIILIAIEIVLGIITILVDLSFS